MAAQKCRKSEPSLLITSCLNAQQQHILLGFSFSQSLGYVMARIRLCLVSCKAKRCNQVCCRWQRRTLRPHQCGELTKATTYAANPPNSARNNAKICLKYATSLRHFLLDLTGDVPGCAENLHIDPQTTFGRTCPKYYQLDPVCIGISESKFLTRMK